MFFFFFLNKCFCFSQRECFARWHRQCVGLLFNILKGTEGMVLGMLLKDFSCGAKERAPKHKEKQPKNMGKKTCERQ